MKLFYTEQAIKNLNEALSFIAPKVSNNKLFEIQNQILNKAESLLSNPEQGQEEPYLAHLRLQHRRIIERNYKIIYRIIGDAIYITDIFDSRQDPMKMNG